MTKYLLLLLLIPTLVSASCPHLYPNNSPIVIPGAIELCNDQYVSLYDPLNRAVLLTSELVQPTGHDVPRKNSFKKDKRVKNGVSPAEYNHSLFDKGHVAPADDATTATQMTQSMLMTNMTPQAPKLNRGRWKSLESKVRSSVENEGRPAHVLTIVIYDKNPPMLGLIPIPKAYAKVPYLAKGPVVYYTSNTDIGKIDQLNIDQLNKLIRFTQIGG